MRFDFNHFYPLILLLPTGFIILFTYVRLAKKNTRQKVFLFLRLLAVISLILSMCSVQLIRTAEDTATLILCDLSDSTLASRTAMESFVSQAIKAKGADDIVGILAFGKDSSVENSPSKAPVFAGFQAYINTDFTNIQNALLHGSALFPSNVKKRIVLVTDGMENVGDAERQLRALVQSDTIVDVYPITKGEFNEVQLSEVEVPEDAGMNQVIDITVGIESNVETDAVLRLYAGNTKKLEQNITLHEGENQLVFTDTVGSEGILIYRVEILPTLDTYMENNTLSSYINVGDKPSVLIVQDEEEQGKQLIEILNDSAIIDICMPEEAPSTLENLIRYDTFILADISYERLSEEFVMNLQSVVKNQGKGLLVTGGDSSYGPGGYFLTPLEEMLPVNMEVKPKEEKPNLGLVLVIDKSGSMTEGQYGISKLELAKEAAIRSTEVLEEKDQLGVIAFDDSAKWVIEMTAVTDKVALQDEIATIRPGGGTSIQPSVKAAVEALKNSDTKLKHIILLTDGQAETTGYESVMNDCVANGITLSTVAVGQGADRQLLNALATKGNGRYYETDEFTDIPSIFTKEAFMAGKKYLNNITFTPTLMNWSQVMKGIEAVPELDGYVATSIKENARLLLAGPEEDPIFATWQYGLGRTAAWTSDANGIWTGKWMSWSESPLFWSNIISWLVQENLEQNYTVSTRYLAGEGVITVESTDPEATLATEIQGVIVNPNGEEQTITLEATSPGTYTGTFATEGEGVYLANLLMNQGDSAQSITTGLNIGYSPEYDFYGDSGISPERMIQISGGRILQSAKEIYEGKVPPVQGSKDLTNIFLLLALIVFLSEIAIRKTYVNLSFLERGWKFLVELILKMTAYIQEKFFLRKQSIITEDGKAKGATRGGLGETMSKVPFKGEHRNGKEAAGGEQGNTKDTMSTVYIKDEHQIARGANTKKTSTVEGQENTKEAITQKKSKQKNQGQKTSKQPPSDAAHLDTLLTNKRKRDG